MTTAASPVGQHGGHLLLSVGWVAVMAGLVVRSRFAPRRAARAPSPSRAGRMPAALRGWPGLIALLTAAAADVYLTVVGDRVAGVALSRTLVLVLTVGQFGFAVLSVVATSGFPRGRRSLPARRDGRQFRRPAHPAPTARPARSAAARIAPNALPSSRAPRFDASLGSSQDVA